MTRSLAIGTTALVVALVAAATPAAAAYSVQSVQFPTDLPFTQFLGTNGQGVIVGYHGEVVNSGFTFTQPNVFTDTNFTDAAQTQVTGIAGTEGNASKVGFYVDTSEKTHGFILIPGSGTASGAFFTIDKPNTVFTQVLGIDSAGKNIAGYSSTDQTGMTLQLAFVGTTGPSGTTFTDIDRLLPKNLNSQAAGINAAGAAVGFYLPATGPNTSLGFEDINGAIRTVDPFGSNNTQALGINNNGELVGTYTDEAGDQHGFIEITGEFSSFDPAGSSNTTINGVNDQGQIVGFYTDKDTNVTGFVATPVPEPESIALLCMGLFGIAALRRRS